MLHKRSSFLLSLAASAVLGVNALSGAAVVPGFNTGSLAANDDDSTGLLNIGFSANFFGTTYTQLYANNNGNVTFDAELSAFTPFNLLSTSSVIIAPFFADVDTSGNGSDLLRYGTGSFGGHDAFGVTWAGDGVGYYGARVDKLNKFQLLLVERADTGAAGNFDIYFNYDQIQWETGEASGGTNGLGGDSARAGYSNGSDTAYEILGSAIDGAFLDGGPNSLVAGGNTDVAGRFLFEVRNGAVVVPPPPTGSVPDTGSSLALLGVALAGLAAARRRLS